MIALGATIIAVFGLLCLSELLWRRRNIETEYTRKFVHISVGSFVAFWPLFLSTDQIIGLSLAFVVVVLLSNYLQIFKAVHSVQRPTWGEIMFALSVGIVAMVAHSGWVYLAALLHMSLADGLAAVLGTKFGRSTRYRIFGQYKSIVGTVTFLSVSLCILVGYALFTPNAFSLWFIPLVVAATILENVSVRGLDNLLVPVLVAIVLNRL